MVNEADRKNDTKDSVDDQKEPDRLRKKNKFINEIQSNNIYI